METRSNTTVVAMPDDKRLEVIYYCMDRRLEPKEKERQAQLFIQLYDCICVLKIRKAICDKPAQLERIVHNKVINTKGYIC